jgi:hypothetical protein
MLNKVPKKIQKIRLLKFLKNNSFSTKRAEAWSGEGRARAGGRPGGSGRGTAFQTQRLWGRQLEEQRKVSWIFLAGWSVLATPLRMSPFLYFWQMSGFEPKELPQQAGALPTWHPSPYLATYLPNLATLLPTEPPISLPIRSLHICIFMFSPGLNPTC